MTGYLVIGYLGPLREISCAGRQGAGEPSGAVTPGVRDSRGRTCLSRFMAGCGGWLKAETAGPRHAGI